MGHQGDAYKDRALIRDGGLISLRERHLGQFLFLVGKDSGSIDSVLHNLEVLRKELIYLRQELQSVGKMKNVQKISSFDRIPSENRSSANLD